MQRNKIKITFIALVHTRISTLKIPYNHFDDAIIITLHESHTFVYIFV